MAHTYLIVNADDFGLSAGVNAGVIRAHQEGILTSTSMMVRWPVAGEAAAYGRATPGLAIGLHVDLGEWTYADGAWSPLYTVVDVTSAEAVESEVQRQVEEFRDLLGRDPSHLDTHQHAHLKEPARSIVTGLGRRLGRPVRHFAPGIRYLGGFYGQTADGALLRDAVSVDALAALIGQLTHGIVELACHPALAPDMGGMYREERPLELASLCHPAVRETLVARRVELLSFADVVEAAGRFTIRPAPGNGS